MVKLADFIKLFIISFFIQNGFSQQCETITDEKCSCLSSKLEYSITCNAQSSQNPFFKTDEMRKYNTLFNVRISYKNYTIIPENVFQGIRVKILMMSACQIQSVSKGAFNGILALSELDLNGNRLGNLKELNAALSKLNESIISSFNKLNLNKNAIENINDEFPQTLRFLTQLSLSFNKITVITSNLFKNLVSLKILRLDSNPIYVIENNCFRNQSNLLEFYLDESVKFTELTDDSKFYGLSKLSILSIKLTNLEIVADMRLSNTPNLTHMYLYNNKIKKFQITSDLSNKVKVLDLTLNQIQQLNENMFRSFGNLDNLRLSNNKIQLIQRHSFNGLGKLIQLDLSDNQIEKIDPLSFIYLSSLESLNLGANLIKFIDNQTFHGLDKLKLISLEKNQIKTVGARSFAIMGNLQKNFNLFLKRQKLTDIEPFAFVNLKSVSELYAQENFLTRIKNNSFVGLENLTDLILETNLINHLELLAFNVLVNLELLQLSSNCIEYIQPGMFECNKKLKSIYLGNNFLTILDSSLLSRFIFLEELILINNPIVSIKFNTISFDNSTSKLVDLSMSETKLLIIKNNYFNNLEKLKYLVLSDCQITAVRFDAFYNLTQLNILDLSNNFIFKLDPRVFKSLKLLQSLNLEGNLLLDIHQATFQNFIFIGTLNLRSNRIYNLTSKHFLNSTKRLKILNLESNNIMSLNLTELEDVDSNLKIMLSSNDLRQIEVMKKIANLDLSSNFKLRKVVLSNLDKLDLSNNKQIFQLENQNAIFKELKSLVISNTTLKLLKSINISLLVKLKSLDLSYLPLDSITLEKIEYLPNLKEIYLQNCSINTKISFSSLHLEKVDLSHNPFLKHFNGDFLARSSETLILLNLCNVNISEMVNISSFTKLNYLDLSSNLLTRIKNTDIFYNSLLLNLNLSNNLIEVIEMGTFQNQLYLNTIDLRYNRIRNFEDINQPDLFKHLIYLHLTDCQNVSIESMGFFQLEYLDLARNDLTKIPQSDVNSHVFYLYMSENLIENVTNSSLANLRNLKELDLSHNKITTIEPDAFSYFVMIKKIDLSSNKLEYLHPNLLNQLKTIYPLSLNLSNNFLKSIDSEFFVNLRSLEKLDLSFNKIHLIEDDTFVNSAQLKDLYLNHNMNISLSNRTFVGFMLIKNIYLSPDFFDSKDNTNFNSVLDVFDPVQPRNLGSIFYYASIDMIYIPPDSYIYDQDLCNIELKFLANSLHLNLKTETHVKRFWENCEFNFNAIG